MPKNENNPYTAYSSTPYDIVSGVYQSIFPEPLTDYGKQYSNGVADVSGYSVNQLKAELDKGNPVVVYITMDFEEVVWKNYDIGGKTRKLIRNMHVVLLTGYNSNGSYHVTDPAGRGKYWVRKSKFETAYNLLQWGVVVR